MNTQENVIHTPTRKIGSFDTDRMSHALSSDKIKLPKGLTREQKRAFLSGKAS